MLAPEASPARFENGSWLRASPGRQERRREEEASALPPGGGVCRP